MKIDWIAVAFTVVFCQTFGWIYFDGRKRRNLAYRAKVEDGLSRLPSAQRSVFIALFYPQTVQTRWFQAIVVGTCSLILALPIYLPVAWYLYGSPYKPLGAIVVASYLAALLGEFLLNWSTDH